MTPKLKGALKSGDGSTYEGWVPSLQGHQGLGDPPLTSQPLPDPTMLIQTERVASVDLEVRGGGWWHRQHGQWQKAAGVVIHNICKAIVPISWL